MASRALNLNSPDWDAEDIAVLEEVIRDSGRLDVVVQRFPDRTLASIKTKMSKVRRQIGLKGKRGATADDQDVANAKAIVATRELLIATVRVGYWS